jgi:hypothetical protein
MKESKIHATERLRREGRWDEASAFRDNVRKRLRADGKPKSEANDLAWEAMIDKYQPLGCSRRCRASVRLPSRRIAIGSFFARTGIRSSFRK